MPGTGKTQPTRHSSRILGVSDGNMTSEVGLPRRRPGIEPHAQPHGRQGQVDENDLVPSLHSAFPQGSLWRERPPPREGQRVAEGLPPLTSPAPRQRRKRGGRSLHQHPSRAARRCAGREGDTRGTASLRFVARDGGNPCYPASLAEFRESPKPQRRGLRPLRERRCGCRDRRHLRSPPPRLKGGGPSDGICSTPRGGRRRSFPGHRMRLCLAPIGALY